MTELSYLQRKVSEILPDIEARFNESMAKHTSFRIGGGAEVMMLKKEMNCPVF